MSFQITDSVSWVGKTDWELRYFHGRDYYTQRGSTYNSYLIRDTKTVLVDTVSVFRSHENLSERPASWTVSISEGYIPPPTGAGAY